MTEAYTITVGFAAGRTDKMMVIQVGDSTLYVNKYDAAKLCNLMNAAMAMEFHERESFPVQDAPVRKPAKKKPAKRKRGK